MALEGIDARVPMMGNQLDIGAMFEQAYKIRGLRQDDRNQNALKNLLSQPGSIDDDGLPTRNALKWMTGQGMGDQVNKVIETRARSEEQKAIADYRDSEAHTASVKRSDEILDTGLSYYDDALKAGILNPDLALEKAKNLMKDQIDAEPTSWDQRQKSKQMIEGADAAQLRAMSHGIKTHLSAAAGDKVEILHDRVTNQDYRYNPATMDATTLTGQPYTPKSAEHLEVEGAQQRIAQGDERIADDRLRIKQGDQRIAIAREAAFNKTNLTPEAIDGTAEQILAGDRAALTNMGRGKQGGADLAAIRNRVWELADQRGISGQGLANIDAAFKGQTAGEVALGKRGSLLDQAGIALDYAAKQSKDAYAALPRGDIVPFNRFQKMWDDGTSSPEQAAAYTADQFVINAWARAQNPTGVITEGAKSRGAQVLSNLTGQKGHDAAIDQMIKEVTAERSATTRAQSNLREPGASPPGTRSTIAHPKTAAEAQALAPGTHWSRPGDAPGTYRVR